MRKISLIMSFVVLSQCLIGCVGFYAKVNNMLYGKGFKSQEDVAYDFIQKYPNTDRRIYECIKNEKIRVGMRKREVLASWGEPTNRITNYNGESDYEQWRYSRDFLHTIHNFLELKHLRQQSDRVCHQFLPSAVHQLLYEYRWLFWQWHN